MRIKFSPAIFFMLFFYISEVNSQTKSLSQQMAATAMKIWKDSIKNITILLSD